MKSALWIAVGAATLVVPAHVGLLWWFVMRKDKDKHKDGDGGDR